MTNISFRTMLVEKLRGTPSYLQSTSSEHLLPRADQQALLLRIRRPSTGSCLPAILLCPALDPRLQFGPEVPNQTLERPRESLAQRCHTWSARSHSQVHMKKTYHK